MGLLLILYYSILLQAYYHRGNARMKLKQAKGIQDFNRALALDPTLFQVTTGEGVNILKPHFTPRSVCVPVMRACVCVLSGVPEQGGVLWDEGSVY